jgi:rare lipoprotein A (peptidoglycan hydrolase)
MATPAAADVRQLTDRASRSYARFESIDAAAAGPAVPLTDPATAAVTNPTAVLRESTVSAAAKAVTSRPVKAPAPRSRAAGPASSPTTRPRPTTTIPPKPAHSETGDASWYDAPDGTCANNDAPMGTVLTVTDLASGKSVTCQVTSRGPQVSGRIVDLARATFSQLADPSAGVIHVRVTW